MYHAQSDCPYPGGVYKYYKRNWIGIEDALIIESGPNIVEEGMIAEYILRFIDAPPYGDYLLDMEVSLLLEYTNGKYELNKNYMSKEDINRIEYSSHFLGQMITAVTA